MKRTIVGLGLSSIVLLSPAVAVAQNSQPSESSGVNDIIVTAQRREQTLTSVPLSISAATGENLAAKGLGSITDLRFETPGFISQSGTGYTQIYIRGIGNGIFVGADPSVATFIDDVPRVYGSLVDNFINVERVEVLKGAQGGLYGRNATGGVINIITRQPDDEMAMKGKFSFGQFQSLDASAYVNIPLGDRVAVNFSANRRHRDPYLKNVAVRNPYPAGTTSFFGDPNSTVGVTPLNNADFYALDSKLRIDLTDNVTVTLAADYSKKNDADGNGWKSVTPENQYLVYLGYVGASGISNPLPASAFGPLAEDEVLGGLESFSHTEDYGFSGTIDVALDGFDLKSITALRYNNSNFRGDIGAGPVPMAGFFTDFGRKFFYQELRLVSTGSGPLRFLGGVSYFHDNIDNLLRGLFIGFPTSDTVAFTKTTNWSAYGEVTYDATDRLTITGSLRYVTEKKNAVFPAGGGAAGDQGEEFARTKQSKLLPSANISYDVGNGIVYARYARGFKTGGVNPIVRPSAFKGQPGSTFAPEVVDSFEAGYRANLFDRRVQLTTAVFYNNYKGVHVPRAGNAANPTLSNAVLSLNKARTYGAEAAITWQVTPELTISANAGYLNAKYKDASYPGSPVVDPFDASGNVMALSPKFQGGVSVNLDQPVNDAFRIKGTVLYSHVGRYNYQYEEIPALFQPAYDVVNLRAGVATIDDNLGLYVFANNVFDKYYSIFGTGLFNTLLTPAAPRVIGGTVEFSF